MAVKRKPPRHYSPDELIKCLICNKPYARPASHAVQKHGLSAYEYKKTFQLPTRKGIIPEALKQTLQNHLQDNPQVFTNLLVNGMHTRLKPGQVIPYERTPEHKARLAWNLSRHNPNRPIGGIKPYAVRITSPCQAPGCTNSRTVTETYHKKHPRAFCSVKCRNITNNLNNNLNKK